MRAVILICLLIPVTLSAPLCEDSGDCVDSEEEIDKREVCRTKECHQIANEFLASLNKSVDPCSNFYTYACGGWASKNPIPKYAPGWSRFMMFQLAVERRIKEVLETEPEPQDILPVRQAKKWYRACMDTKTREARGLKPIESILMQTGGWPMIMDTEEWNDEDYTWQSVEYSYFRLTGTYTFYSLKGLPASKSQKGIITILGPDLPLAQQFRPNGGNGSNEILLNYKLLMTKIAKIFIKSHKADVSSERLEKDVESLVAFENDLLTIQENQTYHGKYISLRGWYKKYEENIDSFKDDEVSKIPWKVIMEQLFDFGNVESDDTLSVIIGSTSYFTDLSKLLGKTPRRTIINFIHWYFLMNILKYVDVETRNISLELGKNEDDNEKSPPAWLKCVKDVKMEHATAYGFISKYFDKETEKAASKLINNIKNQLEEEIESSDWMDEGDKKLIKEKLNTIRYLTGFPEWYKNKTAVVNYYKGLIIDYEYFDNVLSFMRYTKKLEVRSLVKNEESSLWRIEPTRVNAIYLAASNTMNIPAVDFQSPLFAPSTPEYVNYGVTGLIIGHEMSHAFDVRAIMLGPDGKKNPLASNTVKKYSRATSCFEEQFYNYFRNETALSGKRDSYIANRAIYTMGENMADTTALQSVFKAYKKIRGSVRPEGELKLPGLEEFTDEQLFFLSFAGTWCEVGTEEYLQRRELAMDSHSPPHIRVLGALSNLKEFSEVFRCPVGSFMNPEQKCSIWKTTLAPGFESQMG